MLQLSGEKMSKSLGNLVTVDEFLGAHSGDAFRMLVLNSSYRGPLTYTDDVVRQAESALERLRSALKPAVGGATAAPGAEGAVATATAEARRRFEAAMDDDFNTAGALSHLFELVRAINQARDAGAGERALNEAQSSLRSLASVLGLKLKDKDEELQPAAPFVDLLLEVREEMRQAKQWAVADRIRDRLAELGVLIEDGKGGTIWRRR
jgi:cysteinyl-tRNA synthetase